jgi:hypothetical protein
MGETNTYRYVNTNNVPNSNTSTYTFSSGNGDTVDLGVANTYRYVNAGNVYNKGRSDDYGMLYSETNRIPNLLACLRIATDWFRFHSHFQFRIVSGSCYSKLTPGVSGSGSSGRPWQFDDDWDQNWNGYFVRQYNYHNGNHAYEGFTNPGVVFGSPYADYCYYNQGDTRLCVLYIGYDPTAT